jgi:class 3 adenylate cyclase/tetratricopeptide (TPR) repeat protein
MTTNATVTLLFSDLIDATELLERLGEEGAQSVRQSHFHLLRDAVAHHGGHEVKVLNDGLMVVFQSAVDAVACAVAIAQAVERQNRREPSARVDVRLGVNVGEPTRDGEDYFGLPVVLAKRLCDGAGPGQILVSDVVRALVGPRTSHRFRALEPRDLKGVGITAIYEIEWEPLRRGTGPLPPALVPPADGCFVGRERELDRLGAAWKEAATGTRRAVLIGGEPGVGKTRLAAELATEVHGDGLVLYGRCDEDLGVPYQPFAEAVRACAQLWTDEELGARIGPNAASLARLVPELRERLPEIPSVVAGEAEAERYLLFEAVAEFLASAADEQPVLLVLDDLHWAAKPTLVLLRHLLRSTLPMSVLMVGTFRDTELDRAPVLAEALADLRRDADVERISLSGLDRASVAAFVAAVGYAPSDATTELAEAVHAGTEGNPFFVGEILRHLKESGESEVTGASLPPGVKDVVVSRLTRLSATANRMLTMASVTGARFELSVLERLSDIGADELLDALDEAVRARVIIELPTVGHYTFAHSLIRRVLLDELTASRRARMHWRVTDALASMPDAGQRLEELAFHSAEAGAVGDVARAAAYALAASRAALDRLAYEEAVEIAQRGIDVIGPSGTADPRQRAELLLALAEARDFTGDVPSLKQAAYQAAIEARSVKWAEGLARAAVLYGRWVVVGQRDPIVEELCEEGLAAVGDDLLWRGRLTTTLVNYLVSEGRLASVDEMAEASVAMARETNDVDGLAAALYQRTVTLAAAGRIEERLALSDELVHMTEMRDSARGRLDGLVVRATTRLEAGDAKGFEADTQEMRRLASTLNWWAADFWASTFETTMRMLHGEFDGLEAAAGDQYARGSQDINAFNVYAVQLFWLRRELGGLEDLEPLMTATVAQSPELVAFKAALALAHVESGRTEEAAATLDELAADGFAALPRDQTFTAAVALLTDVAAQTGAAQHAERLRPLLTPHQGHLVLGGPAIACFGAADRFLGMVDATVGDADAAVAHYEAAADLETSLGARPALARTRYWWGRLLLGQGGAGQREGRALLADVAETAETLGMRVLCQRVRETLAG